MSEEIKEENLQNPDEEETSEEEPQTEPEEAPKETPQSEKETPEKTDSPKEEYSDREKRLYARMKQAEEDAKKAKEDLAKSTKPQSDVDAIVEVQQATDGLDPTEIAELKNRATITGLSLLEARKDDNFVLWQTAYRTKVEKEKALNPSTRQEITEKEQTFAEKLAGANSKGEKDWRSMIDKKEKLLIEAGLYKDPREGKRPSSDRIQLSQ